MRPVTRMTVTLRRRASAKHEHGCMRTVVARERAVVVQRQNGQFHTSACSDSSPLAWPPNPCSP